MFFIFSDFFLGYFFKCTPIKWQRSPAWVLPPAALAHGELKEAAGQQGGDKGGVTRWG